MHLPSYDAPALPDEQKTQSTAQFRYEDISQDGRVKLLSLPHALGAAVWQNLLAAHPLTRVVARQGMLPILSRIVVVGGGDSMAVHRPVDVSGCYQLAHTVAENGPDAGRVNRLILNMWISLVGTIGKTNGPPPPRAGERAFVGSVFAEHVITRPFAAAGERKVLRFPDGAGLPEIPVDRYVWPRPDALVTIPDGAEPLDATLLADPPPVVFGLTHTDSNQHVNSLIYPRFFEESALRRLDERQRGTRFLARHLEIAYRKPCFVGDRVQVWLQSFAWPEGTGAVGAFLPEGADGTDPLALRSAYCTLRMTFSP